MGKTSIEWCDRSINPIRARQISTGNVGHYCEKISPGCAHCYASSMQNRFGLPEFKGARKLSTLPIGENGTVRVAGDLEIFFDESKLIEVLRRKTPTKWFWCDMIDLFGSWVPDGWIVKCWMAMLMTPWHTHQVLTKRPDRMREFVTSWGDLAGEPDDAQLVRGPDETRNAHPSGRGQLYAAKLETMGTPPPGCAWPTFDWMEGPRWWPTEPADIWIGVSVEDQKRAEERIPLLLQTLAAVRFLSVEPLLGPIDLSEWIPSPDLSASASTPPAGCSTDANGTSSPPSLRSLRLE